MKLRITTRRQALRGPQALRKILFGDDLFVAPGPRTSKSTIDATCLVCICSSVYISRMRGYTRGLTVGEPSIVQ